MIASSKACSPLPESIACASIRWAVLYPFIPGVFHYQLEAIALAGLGSIRVAEWTVDRAIIGFAADEDQWKGKQESSHAQLYRVCTGLVQSMNGGDFMALKLVGGAALIALSLTAHADSGDDYLATVDNKANAPEDTWFAFQAVTQEPGKTARTMTFEVQNKGERRMVKFLAPSDMKGTRVLVLSRSQMWVYLPAYRKVRRVASHVKQQGFMGTTYSDEDMSTTQFGSVYSARIANESETNAVLVLTPRPGAASHYSKIDMTIRKDLMLPSQLDYYNLDGVRVKTETRSDYDCDGGLCTPGLMKMVDHTRAGAWTTLEATERKVNQGISETVFSVRNLERGR